MHEVASIAPWLAFGLLAGLQVNCLMSIDNYSKKPFLILINKSIA